MSFVTLRRADTLASTKDNNEIYVKEGSNARLVCDFELRSEKEDNQEEVYSVVWYLYRGSVNQSEKFPFFRFRSIDEDGEKKRAWLHNLRGKFSVNVSV